MNNEQLYIVETDAGDWEVRVSLDIPRFGGRLVASCPSERLANLVINGIGWMEDETGIKTNWKIEFEVTE